MKQTFRSGDELVTFRLRNGQSIATRADARFILNEIFLDRVYDVPGVDLGACRAVLDVGANVGMFALYVLASAPEATVYSFEPSSQNFAVLEENIRRSTGRVKSFKLAVGEENTIAHLSLAGHSVEFALAEAGPATEVVECVDLRRVLS